jgi:hypothetical protein
MSSCCAERPKNWTGSLLVGGLPNVDTVSCRFVGRTMRDRSGARGEAITSACKAHAEVCVPRSPAKSRASSTIPDAK